MALSTNWLSATIALLLLATNVAGSIETLERATFYSDKYVASTFDYNCGIDKEENQNPSALQLRDLPIGLQITNDITHQLVTRIFAIFLKEVLHYSNVTLIPIHYEGDIDDPRYDGLKFMHFFDLLHYHKDFPDMGMINMALWLAPLGYSFRFLNDAGLSMSAGRFGWFVPRDLIRGGDVERSFYLLHYKVFSDPNTQDYRSYLMDEPLLRRLKREAEATYVSPKCLYMHCVTLLAQYQRDTAFAVHHIEEMKLYVNIIWLGDGFEQKIKEFFRVYHENVTYAGRRFILLHWTPSDIIETDIKYQQIMMPHCEDFKSMQDSLCKYEMTPIVKYYSNNFEDDTNKPLLHALREFYISDENRTMLYGEFKRRSIHAVNSGESASDIYNDLACDLLKKDGYKDLISTDPEITLSIGGIFPMTETSRGHENLGHAVDRAVDAIKNNSKILRNYNFEVQKNDGKCRPDLVMKSFIHFFNVPKVLGILGPACSETVEPIAGISKHTNMAVISYSAEGASFVDRHAYPYFFRTIGSNFQYEDVYIALMRRLHWRRVAALTEDGQKYTEYISHMEATMKQLNLDLIMNKKFLSDVSAADMNKHLLDLREKHARIIIADIHNRNAELALCEAFKLGMTANEGYVWFLPPWLSKDWELLSKRNNNSCSSDDLQKAYEGHFSILHTPFGNFSQKMQENKTIQEWLDAYDTGNRSISNYIGFAYDAVWAYAIAADKLLKENPDAINNLRTKNVVERFVDLIRQTDFEGLSGRVRFGRGGSRITDVDILQWRQGRFTKVGKFTPKIEGVGSDAYPKGGELDLFENSIKWISGDDPPDDGTFDCKFASLAEIMGDCDSAAVAFTTILCVVVVVVVSLVSFLFWKIRYDKKLRASAKIMKTFGIDLLSPSRNDSNTLDKWEVPKENVVLNRRLGEGAFGTVYGGEALLNSEGWVPVAVKTLKAGASSEDRIDFLSEAEAMKRLDHKNIIKLLGVCLQSEPIYTIMEFMLYGDLKTYLLARRHMVNERLTDESDISPKRLTGYAMDVARGLQYLAQQKYVHRDLACRNCLVNTQRVVKLGDFGMARSTIGSDYYRFNRKGMLPVRWMAPESLALGLFTPASDVWAFGVVAFEIITFGSFPFQGMTNNQVLEFVKSGNSLQVPAGVKPHLEGLMKACWSQEPKKRPTAKEIVEYISNHPRLLTPCLDFPGASVEMPETESDQLELLPKGRKGTPLQLDSTLDILAQTTNTNNNNNNICSNDFERNRQLIDELHQMNRNSSDDDNDTTSTVDANYAQHMCVNIDIPQGRTDVRETALAMDAFSPTTPDGYSIMAPLLMHQVSESSDSSQSRLQQSQNLQQSSF